MEDLQSANRRSTFTLSSYLLVIHPKTHSSLSQEEIQFVVSKRLRPLSAVFPTSPSTSSSLPRLLASFPLLESLPLSLQFTDVLVKASLSALSVAESEDDFHQSVFGSASHSFPLLAHLLACCLPSFSWKLALLTATSPQ